MTLKAQLLEDMKTAMKARDSIRLGAIRFLMSEIKNYEIDNGEQDDAGIQAIIRKQIKQMKDALVEFEKAGRTDIVAEETQKVAVFERYLPAQMTDEALQTLVADIRAQHPEFALGQVIGAVKEKAADQADGARIASAVKATF